MTPLDCTLLFIPSVQVLQPCSRFQAVELEFRMFSFCISCYEEFHDMACSLVHQI